MRSGSFSDVVGAALEAKRKKWLLERSGSLRLPGKESNKYKREAVVRAASSPWSSPEIDRRGSLPVTPKRERSLDRVQLIERRGSCSPNGDIEPGKVKGFVNR